MNEDNLNMEIRKFLKNVGITSQRVIENAINEANGKNTLPQGKEIDLEMTLSISCLDIKKIINGKIKID